MLHPNSNYAAALCFALVTAVVLVSAGCSKSPYDLAHVRGKVTIDGKPLSIGKVMFAPIAQGESREVGKPAFGALQSDGSFVLTTFQDGDGAVVGEHWVTIFGPDEETDMTRVSVPAGTPKFSRLSVPQKKSVAGGRENDVEVALTSHDVARFGTL